LNKEICAIADLTKRQELLQALEKIRVGLTLPGADFEEKFGKYKEMLVRKGYFANVEEGSAEYNSRLEKARVRFTGTYTAGANPLSSSSANPLSSSSSTTPLTTSTSSSSSTSSTSSMPAPTSTTEAAPTPEPVTVSEEDAKKAEEFKEQGNEFFKNKQFQQAIDCYTKSIMSNPTNAVVWSNRGLAWFRCTNYKQCVDDQLQSIKCNSQYEKAYSRLGSAYAAMNDYTNAQKAFEDCLAVNPNDNTAKQELEKLKQTANSKGGAGGLDNVESSAFPGFPGFPGGGGGGPGGMPNMFEMMNNPQFMQMASQMMENPQIRQMAEQMAQNPEMMQQFLGNMPDLSSMGLPPKQ